MYLFTWRKALRFSFRSEESLAKAASRVPALGRALFLEGLGGWQSLDASASASKSFHKQTPVE